eukprot:642440-Rhodomonas_salina.1
MAQAEAWQFVKQWRSKVAQSNGQHFGSCSQRLAQYACPCCMACRAGSKDISEQQRIRGSSLSIDGISE